MGLEEFATFIGTYTGRKDVVHYAAELDAKYVVTANNNSNTEPVIVRGLYKNVLWEAYKMGYNATDMQIHLAPPDHSTTLTNILQVEVPRALRAIQVARRVKRIQRGYQL